MKTYLFVGLLLGAAGVLALTPTPAPTLSASRWEDLGPGTQIQPQCPPDNFNGWGYDFYSKCKEILDWSSGVWDGNAMLIFGGGHSAYYGNEVYAVDPVAKTVARLTDPIGPFSQKDFSADPPPGYLGTCAEHHITVMPDQPKNRHTYGGMVWIPTIKRMRVFGGAPGVFGCGSWEFARDAKNALYISMTHLFDPVAKVWTGTVPTQVDSKIQNMTNMIEDWDANKRRIVGLTRDYIYQWVPGTAGGAYTLLKRLNSSPLKLGTFGAINPDTNQFIVIGRGEALDIDLNTYSQTHLTFPNCPGILKTWYPGIAYDPVAKDMVVWNGGDTIYHLDASNKCTTETVTGGPASVKGRYILGRFRYVPSLDAFMAVTDVDRDAYLLHLAR